MGRRRRERGDRDSAPGGRSGRGGRSIRGCAGEGVPVGVLRERSGSEGAVDRQRAQRRPASRAGVRRTASDRSDPGHDALVPTCPKAGGLSGRQDHSAWVVARGCACRFSPSGSGSAGARSLPRRFRFRGHCQLWEVSAERSEQVCRDRLVEQYVHDFADGDLLALDHDC